MKKQTQQQKTEAPPVKMVTTNRKAYHDYEIIEKHEAGMMLVGTEVKSIYLGKANLQDSYCKVDSSGELWVLNMYVAPYEQGGLFNPETRRTRKLLMHRKEIERISAKAQEKSYTIIPLALYFKRGKVKIEIGLARGKRQYDKCEQIAERDSQREQQRQLAERQR